MSLFGLDMETWKPYYGCTTFTTDIQSGRLTGWYTTLAELHRHVVYHYINKECMKISIQKLHLDSGGYTSSGRYLGRETNTLYKLTIDDDNERHVDYVRAPNIGELKKAFRLMYPSVKFVKCKVCQVNCGRPHIKIILDIDCNK